MKDKEDEGYANKIEGMNKKISKLGLKEDAKK